MSELSDYRRMVEKPTLDAKNAEIARLRAALNPFARHAHCTDQIQRSSLALWCAQALNALAPSLSPSQDIQKSHPRKHRHDDY